MNDKLKRQEEDEVADLILEGDEVPDLILEGDEISHLISF